MIETDWLKRWNRYRPNKTAVRDLISGRKLSYSDLYFKSCEIADNLIHRFDIHKGDRIACLASNRVEFLPLFFAAQRVGAILVPINFRLQSREIDFILSDCQPKLLIVEDRFESTIAQCQYRAEEQWSFSGEDESLSEIVWAESAVAITCKMRAEFKDPALILYTSGTTGFPKGALITHEMMFWNSVNTTWSLDLTSNDVTISFLPFFHTSGWNVLNTPFLHRGAELLFLPQFDAKAILRAIEDYKVSIVFGVPTTMNLMAQEPVFADISTESVKFAIVGGEPMPVELIKQWEAKGVPIRQGYGLTEFGPNVSSLSECDSQRKMGSIGFTNFYIDEKLVDADGQEVRGEGVGELALRGPMCMGGYWRNEEATKSAIRDGWLHTGDMVRRDSEGYYYVVGRKKEMYISGGENVYPAEVERVISSIPEVREVAVVGVPDNKWGEVGKAYVVAKKEITNKAIAEFCQERLAKYKVPKHIEFRADLPKGDSGKILKRELH